MNTYTHFLLTALAGDRLKKRGHQINRWGLGLGAIVPDVPLLVVTLGYFAYRAWIVPLPPGEHIFGITYDTMYFENPWMIFGHSLWHSPIMIGLWALLGYGLYRLGREWWGRFLMWMAAGNLLHSIIDIFTHHNDGPLLFYPLDWQTRFITPISYWDPNHYGDIVAPLEHIGVLLILLYFGWQWLRKRDIFGGGSSAEAAPAE